MKITPTHSLLLTLAALQLTLQAAVPLQPYRGSKFTISMPRSWPVTEDAAKGLFLARQDPNRNDSPAVVVMVNAGGAASADQLLNSVAQQFAQDLRIVQREAIPGGGQLMIADGRTNGVLVRVGVIAVAQGGASLVALLVAKPAEFEPVGGIGLVTSVMGSLKANNPQSPPSTSQSQAPPAAGGRPDVPPLTRPLTIAALAGEWNNDDSVMSRYVTYRGDYAGFESIATKEKWIIDAGGNASSAFTGTTAGRSGARQINEARKGRVVLAQGPTITFLWNIGSNPTYLVRGWRDLPGMTVIKLNGPWYNGEVPADVRADLNKGVNLDSLWFRKTQK